MFSVGIPSSSLGFIGFFRPFQFYRSREGGGREIKHKLHLAFKSNEISRVLFFSFILIEDERKELRFEDTNPERKILARNGIPGCFQSLPIETKLRSTFETPTSELGWNNQQPDNGATIDELT